MKTQRLLWKLAALGFITLNVTAQIDTERIPPGQNLSNLYERASMSRFVVIGTVIKDEGILRRMTPEVFEKAKEDLGAMLGGSLYSIAVERTVCRQHDFQVAKPPSAENFIDPGSEVDIFVPYGEPMFVDGYLQEALQPGKTYLIFLVESDQQTEWLRIYELDPQRTYYRAEGRNRGIIPLAGIREQNRVSPDSSVKAPSILEEVTQLCQAMRPPQVAKKISALRKLAASHDPILRKEAQEALRALRVPRQ